MYSIFDLGDTSRSAHIETRTPSLEVSGEKPREAPTPIEANAKPTELSAIDKETDSKTCACCMNHHYDGMEECTCEDCFGDGSHASAPRKVKQVSPDIKAQLEEYARPRKIMCPILKKVRIQHPGGFGIVDFLVDSGSEFSVMTSKTAAAMGLEWTAFVKGDKVCRLKMADGRTTSPAGYATTVVIFPETGFSYSELWYIFEEDHTDVLFGSRRMDALRGIIDFGNRTVTFRDAKGKHFAHKWDDTATTMMSSSIGMYAARRTVVPANSQMVVPARIGSGTMFTPPIGMWGFVGNVNGGPIVAKGITTVAHMGGNWVQILNPTNTPMLIPRGKEVASFHNANPNMFETASAFSMTDNIEGGENNKNPEAEDQAGYEPTRASSTPVEGSANRDDAVKHDTSKPTNAPDPPTTQELPMHIREIKTAPIEGLTTEEDMIQLRALILKYNALWNADRPAKPLPADTVKCTIRLTGDLTAKSAKQRPLNPQARTDFQTLINEQLKGGFIQRSFSPYASQVLLVPKPNGQLRFVVDYRSLNKVLVRDAYTLPRTDELTAKLGGSLIFSSIDLATAFWRVPLDEDSRAYTAFRGPDGLYEYVGMPMGLGTASAVFCRFLDHIVGDLKWVCCLTYIDDVLIYNQNFKDHIRDLDRLFERLEHFGMVLGQKKTYLARDSANFLSAVIDKNGIKPSPEKLKAVSELEMPTTKEGMRSALGLFGYYRMYVKNFARLVAPIQTRLNEREPSAEEVKWAPIEIEAFESLKRCLLIEPVISHPEWSEPFIVHTDACEHGLGAVLSQKVNAKEKVVYYASRSLSNAEKKYATWELEALAVVWALRVFRMWLYTCPFTVYTDSQALARVMKTSGDGAVEGNHRVTRWLLAIQAYNCTILHRPGKSNGNADALSRHPLKSDCPYGEEQEEPLSGNIFTMRATIAESNENDNPIRNRSAKAKFNPEDKEYTSIADLQISQREDEALQKYYIRSNLETQDGHEFKVINGVLRVTLGTAKSRAAANPPKRAVIVVPHELRADLIRRYHGLPICGHPGITRTIAHLDRNFWWNTMRKDVKRWIKACLACSKRKTPRPGHHGLPSAITGNHPFHRVAIDLVQVTVEYILSVLDLFSRFIILIPLKDKTAASVANALFERVFAVLGIPSEIISDEGTEFVNAGIKAMCETWGLRLIPSSGYQPQALPVERYHRWLHVNMTTLRAKFGENSNWESYLPGAAIAYNLSRNEATGYTPHMLMFGRESRIPDDIQFDLAGEEFASEAEYHISASERMKAAYDVVRKNQQMMSDRNKANRLRSAKEVAFLPKDMVLRWDPGTTAPIREGPAPPGKWCYRWSGPHTVLRAEKAKPGHPEGNMYTILDTKSGEEDKVHVNRLVKFHPWDDEIISTSNDIDERPEWADKGIVPIGDFFVFELGGEYEWGIAQRLKRGSDIDGEDLANINFQWYGNTTYNLKKPVFPGWIPKANQKSTNVQPKAIQYASDKPKQSMVPYKGSNAGITLGLRDILLHSFRLTPAGQIPMGVRRVIARLLEEQKAHRAHAQ